MPDGQRWLARCSTHRWSPCPVPGWPSSACPYGCIPILQHYQQKEQAWGVQQLLLHPLSMLRPAKSHQETFFQRKRVSDGRVRAGGFPGERIHARDRPPPTERVVWGRVVLPPHVWAVLIFAHTESCGMQLDMPHGCVGGCLLCHTCGSYRRPKKCSLLCHTCGSYRRQKNVIKRVFSFFLKKEECCFL
ncbi:hypothetical protein VPH35_059255 [Triticum aestivum]